MRCAQIRLRAFLNNSEGGLGKAEPPMDNGTTLDIAVTKHQQAAHLRDAKRSRFDQLCVDEFDRYTQTVSALRNKSDDVDAGSDPWQDDKVKFLAKISAICRKTNHNVATKLIKEVDNDNQSVKAAALAT